MSYYYGYNKYNSCYDWDDDYCDDRDRDNDCRDDDDDHSWGSSGTYNAINDSFKVKENNSLSGNLFANDTDGYCAKNTITSWTGGALGVAVNLVTSDSSALKLGTATLTSGGTLTVSAKGEGVDRLSAGETITKTFNYSAKSVVNNKTYTDTATITITITGVNDAPVAKSDNAGSIAETGKFTNVSVTANDSDIDRNDTHTWSLVSGSFKDSSGATGKGALTMNSNGTFSYDPQGNYNSLNAGQSVNLSFKYLMKDANCATSEATVSFTVTGVSSGPLAVNDSAGSVTEDAVITSNAAANDTGVTSASVYALVADSFKDSTGAAGKGVLTMNANGTWNYNPQDAYDKLGAGQSTTLSFKYSVANASGTPSTATVTFTVTGLNDGPVAVNDSVAPITEAGVLTNVSVKGNDSDIDVSDTHTWSLVAGSFKDSTGAAGKGLLTMNTNGTFSYDPQHNYDSLNTGASADLSFKYQMKDNNGATSEATVSFKVTGIASDPTAVNDNAGSVSEDAVITSFNTAANDINVTNLSVWSLVAGSFKDSTGAAGKGLLTMGNNGFWNYDSQHQYDSLAVGQTANVSFTYSLGNVPGGPPSTATVAFAITGANDAPVAANDNAGSLTESGSLTNVSIKTNDSDIDNGDTHTWSLVAGSFVDSTGAAGKGMLTLNANGTFSYDPQHNYDALNNGESADLSFKYIMKDNYSATSEAVVTFKVTGVAPVGPVAINDYVGGISEDAGVTTFNAATNDTNITATTAFTVVAGSFKDSTGAAGKGALTMNANGTWSYDPQHQYESLAAGQSTNLSFNYTVTDAVGTPSTATVSFLINGANDAPVAVNDNLGTLKANLLSGGNLAANDIDVDNMDPHVWQLVSGSFKNNTTGAQVSESALSVNADGTWALNPIGIFDTLFLGQVLNLSFKYTMTDLAGASSEATVSLNLLGIFLPGTE